MQHNQDEFAPSFLLLPVSSWYVDNPDYSLKDEINEAEKLIDRQNAIESVIVTDTSPELILDLLSDQEGMSPDDYMDEVINAMKNSPYLYA